jgi:phage repressor protein C with HTH and peptisase S24 domain
MAIDQVRSTFIGPANGSIMVRNNAMAPEFSRSNAIAVKLLRNKNTLIPGEVYYVVDNNQEGHLRRLYPDGQAGLRLVSNNPDTYPDYYLTYDQVFVIFKVKANIELF